MKINLNDILINSYERNMKELIVIYDEKDNVNTFTYDNIPDKVKNMKIERFYVDSEKVFQYLRNLKSDNQKSSQKGENNGNK